METSYIIKNAKSFATKAHEGQVRKYTGEPYINHPGNVVDILANLNLGEKRDYILATAWLHDVVEDCGIRNQEIFDYFGNPVAKWVDWLTDNFKVGNRKERKARYCHRLIQAPIEVKTIKLADIIDNTSLIVEYDPNFARVYLAEKRELLEVLKEGDHGLWQRANTQVTQGLLKLTVGGAHD